MGGSLTSGSTGNRRGRGVGAEGLFLGLVGSGRGLRLRISSRGEADPGKTVFHILESQP